MFEKSIEARHFGALHGEGQSKIWETTLDIPPLGKGFFVRVWGGKNGPTESQCDAFGALLHNAAQIKNAITSEIINYLDSCGVVPPDTQVSVSNLWEFLSPCFIEIHDNHEYPAGAGKPGTNAISVGYEIPWVGEALLQIGILEGAVDEIYSE